MKLVKMTMIRIRIGTMNDFFYFSRGFIKQKTFQVRKILK
jgi:hypothetical protein